jgi:hypothetical protein
MGFFPMRSCTDAADIRRPGGRIDLRTGMALFTRTFLLNPLSRIPLRSFALELLMASDSQDGRQLPHPNSGQRKLRWPILFGASILIASATTPLPQKARSAASWRRTETKKQQGPLHS